MKGRRVDGERPEAPDRTRPRRLRRAAARSIVLALVGFAGSAGGVALSAPGLRAPLAVASASLSQSGRQLVWHVLLRQRFSPAALPADRRSLCLLIERARNGTVAGQACLSGGGTPRRPRLVFQRITASGAGAPVRVPATITRTGPYDVTAGFLPAAVGLGYRPLRWQVISTVAAPGCAPLNRAGTRCLVLMPARPRLLSLHVPRLVGCVPSGAPEVFHGSAGAREVALTFDDGPWWDPPAIDFVNLLAREHVPATFFEIGRQIPQFDPSGSAERAMLAHGDMIGGHTWDHPVMTALSRSRQIAEIQSADAAIRQRTGFTPCLWRPPYGAVNPGLVSLARSLGLLTVMWDVDPADWRLPGTATIAQRVISAAHNGAIILQHFGGGPREQTFAALPTEIATLRREHYRFVTVAQLLGLKLVYR